MSAESFLCLARFSQVAASQLNYIIDVKGRTTRGSLPISKLPTSPTSWNVNWCDIPSVSHPWVFLASRKCLAHSILRCYRKYTVVLCCINTWGFFLQTYEQLVRTILWLTVCMWVLILNKIVCWNTVSKIVKNSVIFVNIALTLDGWTILRLSFVEHLMICVETN